MFVYWLMFFIPVYFAFYFTRAKDDSRDLILRLIAVLFAFLIGLRFEVGGDWFTYLDHYRDIDYSHYNFFETAAEWDPGYVLFEYMTSFLGIDIYGVNAFCGVVMMSGVYYFCRRQPQPFLALAIAVPYVIIVIAMGYSRQSVALGLELLALIMLADGRIRAFVFFIVCATLFHKSAALLFVLGVLSQKNKSIGTTLATLAISSFVGWKMLNEHTDNLWTNYVEAEMVSEGALIRVIMNVVPAVLFLVFSKRLAPNESERRIWIWIALFSLACLPLVSSASTAIDRVSLYFLPIQMLVYSRFSYLFKSSSFRFLSTTVVIFLYGLSMFVLLNYGTIITLAWIPYNNVAFFW